ncbi:hypothetical protein [Streptomyces sp. A1136]|uniref:hypothetical protein n=1 Tax=Streptomyces sp. A1136 TaxID=2563102 RepID=UPI00109E8892|nr:hypothetical protein [Streptomyces sp. A1136]THA54262.1 hypothetical protein E6R62_17010 [Streptomyces sp. A1136]
MRATTTPTAREASDLGEAIGKIAAFAAQSLHESFPHLDLEGLVDTFTGTRAVRFIGRRYLAAIEESKTPGEAAGEAGKALIYAWAEARLEARAQLDREADASPWGPMVLCWCETEVRDNAEARQGHHDGWHTGQRPATWSAV